jgi:hypothetical protein
LKIETRAVVEDNDQNLYYPPVVSVNTTDEFPFNPSSARIIIAVGQSGSGSYYSSVQAGNKIRVQTKVNDGKWLDLFNGVVVQIRHATFLHLILIRWLRAQSIQAALLQ